MRRALALAALVAACADVPATNPYDPEAPATTRPPGQLSGAVRLAEGFDADRLLEAGAVLTREGAEVARVSSGWLLLSVPWEPVWRILNVARGRYVGSLGNTPGHVQHFSRRAIRGLVASRFELVAERRPFPWTVLLARLPGAGAGADAGAAGEPDEPVSG